MTAEAMRDPARARVRPFPEARQPQNPAGAPAARAPAAPRRQQAPRARPEKAWWFSIPAVAMACAKVALFPLTVVTKVAELCMAALVLGIAGAGFLWWSGRITDAQVMEMLRPLGDRILAMVQSSGML